MSLSRVRVGGVPEYFNMPWQLMLKGNPLEQLGISLTWQDYSGGTGAMMRDLREEKLDIAIALTEGVVAEIINRDTCRIAQYYVKSPLTWGIHVAASSVFQRVADLQNQAFAISRPGSGSHLMTYVLAQQRQWATDKLKFAEVNNLEGARHALASGAAAGFLWEKFTTQFLVDQGDFRRVGTIDTLWPCFVVAVRTEVANHPTISAVLAALNRLLSQWKELPGLRDQTARAYNLPIAESNVWWDKTQWADNQRVEHKVLNQVVQTLYQVGAITKTSDIEQLRSESCELVI